MIAATSRTMDHTRNHSSSANASRSFPARARWFRRFLPAAVAAAFLALAAGCETPVAAPPSAEARNQAEAGPTPEAQTLRAGDVLLVSFPGASNLNTKQQIRMDGRITLPIVGDVVAVGKTPTELQKELVKLYAPQLVSKEVTVTVIASTFTVYVTGAVIHPGQVQSDHPISALEAIMQAGGFVSGKADMGAVVVIRNEGGKTRRFTLNMKNVLDGRQTQPFYLKPSDVIYVPERFSWF